MWNEKEFLKLDQYEEEVFLDDYDWFENGVYNTNMLNISLDRDKLNTFLTAIIRAIKYYDKELELDPNNVNLYYRKGTVLYYNSDFELAIDCFNKGLELYSGPKDLRNSNYFKALNYKGCALLELGKKERAINVFNNALSLNLTFIDTWNNKGRALSELGKFEEALECYDKALELDINNISTWHNKGIALRELGILDQAIKCFDKALELDPKNISTWIDKALMFFDLGKIEDAIYCYDRVLALYPKAYIIWTQKGVIFEIFGKFEEALESFDNALKLYPKCVDAWISKGIVLRKLGKIEQAIDYFDKAIELDPKNISPWKHKASVFWDLGKLQEAIECCDKALEINPTDNKTILNKRALLARLVKPDIVFELNEFISLKLCNKITLLYLNNEYFDQCMRLFINIPLKNVDQYDSVNSIDEATEIYEKTVMYGVMFDGEHGLEPENISPQILPEEEFWAHCSNMQAWVENDYDTRILHSNIAFPLLKALSDAGDRIARRVFKDEIAERFSSKYKAVMVYLIKEGYLNYLNESERLTLYESVGLDWLINTFMDEKDVDIVDFCDTIRILKEKLEEKRV